MDFNFHDQFKNHSNIDLLKITLRPSDYQPPAFAAANDLLKKRIVLPEETEFVVQYYQNIDNQTKFGEEKAKKYNEAINDVLDPVLKPTEKINARKWVNLFLLLVAFDFCQLLYKDVKVLTLFMQCPACTVTISSIFDILTIIWTLLIAILLFKKKKIGWIFLFASVFIGLFFKIINSYYFFKLNGIIFHRNPIDFIISIVIQVVFVFFLLRKEITVYFNIDRVIKKKTIIASTVLFLVTYVLSIFL